MKQSSMSDAGVAPPAVDAAVVEAIGRMRAPIVVAHIIPDADALGAMFAMARALTGDDCQPKVALPDGSLSQRLVFLYEWSEVRVAGGEDFAAADGFIVVDTAKKDRCNVGPDRWETDWTAGRCVVNIDHHGTNTQFGDVNWVMSDVGSASELVYYLFRATDRPIDPATASCLFAGIHTDTIGFSLPTTTAAGLQAAAELVALGANVTELGERLCRSQRQSEFDLLRVVYANTKVAADGRMAYSSASYDEIHSAGCSAVDIDDQINIPRSLEGAQLAMLFTEAIHGKTRINLRGAGAVTVVDLAVQFGGGGHTQAAGAVLDCGLDEAIERVVPAAVEHLRKFEA